MKHMIPPNAAAHMSTDVDDSLSAEEIGSGDVPVLATPMMIALMESAAAAAVQEYLGPEETTVGSKIKVEHIRPTPLGDAITAEAILVAQDGRRLTFSVIARDSRGLIGQGDHERVIIDKKKFLKGIYPGGE